MVRRLAFVACASGSLAACYFVSDFSNLSGGPTDAGPSPTDVASGDGGTEAGADAGDPCQGTVFCDRFASGDTSAWTRPFESGRAVLAVEPFATAPSPPNVLRVGLPPQPAAGAYTYLSKEILTGKFSRASLAFQLAIERLDPTARACVAAIVFGDNTGAEHVVRLLVGAPGGVLEEKLGSTTKRHDVPGTFTTGSFRELALSVAVGGKIAVDVGGQRALEVAADPSWSASTGVRIVLGINFALGPTNLESGFDLRFDDVRLVGGE